MSAAGVSTARYAGYLKANLRDYGMLLSLVAIMPVGSGAAGTGSGGGTQLLGNLVEASTTAQTAVVSRYNILPAIDVYVGVQGIDLASVASKVEALVEQIKPRLPRGSQVVMRGQVETMQTSFIGLGVGLAMAIVLVYLLIVVNFQSWLDALIIIAALPAALAGIAWTLFITGTTLSVPALTGAIMTRIKLRRTSCGSSLARMQRYM